MLKNMVLVALRNFKRDKWYTLLNVLGLTLGITFSLFLIFYIKDELSYDKYNVNADRIYRISTLNKEADKDVQRWTITPAPLAPVLQKDFPEVEQAVRFVSSGKVLFKNGTLNLYEEKIFLCDSNALKVFTWPLLEGNAATALDEPNSIVLTQSMATKYFGAQHGLLGKTLSSDNGKIYKVTGVAKDVPHNSHFIFNGLISLNSLGADFGKNWGNFGNFTYVLLRPGVNVKHFESKMQPLYDKYLAPIFAASQIKQTFVAQPVTSIHLHSDMEYEPEELGNISYIYIFGAVAFFMLIIACINYMNLTTARSAKRAKEIGIRKVTGSTRQQLVFQFLIESTLTAIFALVISMLLILLLLPTFNLLSGKSIAFNSLLEPGTFLILLGIVLFIGLAGGSYPAFYLSKFNPVGILKGSLSKASGNVALRRTLVVVQFSISMIMIICTWVVYNQLSFLNKKDLGFNKQQVISIPVNSNRDVRSTINAFKNQLKSNPNIISVAAAENKPGDAGNFILFSIENNDGTFKDQGIDNYGIDEDYFNTMQMKLKEGRNFSGPSDTLRSIIVNEKMVKFFGWKNAIGKRVKFVGDTSSFAFEVVGVVKDFNQKSLYNPISPLMLYYRPSSNQLEARLAPQNIPGTVKEIEKLWKANFGAMPFSYSFLDQDFSSQYAADQKRGKIFTTFSILTILITCLGLLGLIAFTTQQRQKEFSIRKIVGAGTKDLVPLVISNFVWLVFISCFIAFPVAYLFMNKWLQIFTYNTGLSVTPFVMSALVVLFITMLTVIFHALRAARANPVNSLRSE